jgi:excisionase family DNA binding protein
MPNDWLTLSDAAEILGVHPSTVRKWSDEGVLPVRRTQGGHRRYLRSEVELWIQSQRPDEPDNVHLVVQSALRNTRIQISEGRLNEEAWYTKLNENAREQYRKSGRTLLQGLIGYLASDGQSARAEAQAVGFEYASRGKRHGLSIADAVNAFLFFRNVLLESMLSMYEEASVRSPYAWSDMFRKVNSFTDHILITLLETYTAYERGNSR